MNGAPDLRRAAREIFDDALKSVNPYDAVRKAVELDGTRLNIVSTSFDLSQRERRRAGVYAIAIGKAALSMATALDRVLGDHLTAGLIASPSQRRAHHSIITPSLRDRSFRRRWRVFHGGHPLPNSASLLAARAAFELLQRAEAEGALLIFLISGGGSALIEWPRDERITLRDLRAANRLLVSCGATIAEVNSVRRAFSAVKGGGLAACAPHADQLSLIISDTGAGEESTVASGPTLNPPMDAPDAQSVVARYELASRLPAAILRAINNAEAAKGAPSRKGFASRRAFQEHYVLLDNQHAMEAAALAARRMGFAVETARDIMEQPIAKGCGQMLSRLLALHRRRSTTGGRRVVCLVSGGEFVCPVRGRGVGGRNSETALRCAIEMDGRALAKGDGHSAGMNIVALSAGTDGIDGNSPAAGALADQETVARGRVLGLDAQHFLDASDAYSFFDVLGDAIVTGPTGTNVRDLRVLLTAG